jgi:hypothetical protein
MKLEEIHEMWKTDGEIDMVNVSKESANTPKLHNKYYMVYVEEGLKLKKLKAEYKKLRLLKEQYYKGELDIEELKEYGWNPQPLKILRQDIPTYLEADDDVINTSLKIGMQEAKVEYLESIIRQINNRGFQIKNIIDWERFRTGA